MKRWISPAFALLAALASLSASAQQTAVPLGSFPGAPYGYYVYLPDGYNGNGTQEWPLVVFLHGAGEVGSGSADDLPRVLAQGLPSNINNGVAYPFVVISPQSSSWWNPANLDAMIEFVKINYRVDLDRIYLTGASMGGGGVWEYAKVHPEKLAAILPICGTESIPNGSRLIGVPTWAFHAWGDGTVPASGSIQWVDAIAGALAGTPPTDVMASYPGTFSGPPGKDATSDRDRTASYDRATGIWTWRDDVPQVASGHPSLTLYKDVSHDTWTRTYANQTVWNWLLAQDRNPANDPNLKLIVPTGAGTAAGSSFFPLEGAFDALPRLSSAGIPVGGSGGNDAPSFGGRIGYIDFGPDWDKVRIQSTWTRYRSWSFGNQTPYAELWWDDDTDSVNDSGFSEARLNFNTAQGLDTGLTEPWLRDSDMGAHPVVPRARYLLCRAPASMTDRAKEYAIVGSTNPPPSVQVITPTAAGMAAGSIYFPMEEAFDAQPTLSSTGEPVGGSGGGDAPFYANRAGYIDFGPEWYKVRITSTWTQYRNWSQDDQTPYAELWWDDDTDSVNDSGLNETRVNFNTAQDLDTGLAEPWLRDRDMGSNPVVPRGRYLLCRTPGDMTNRAKEYAILGYIDPTAMP